MHGARADADKKTCKLCPKSKAFLALYFLSKHVTIFLRTIIIYFITFYISYYIACVYVSVSLHAFAWSPRCGFNHGFDRAILFRH